MKGHRDIRGITLAELLTVIAIAGIVVSIAVISAREHIGRTKLDSAIHMIGADIRRARWIARSTGKPCFIRFDTAANTYTINGIYFAKITEGVKFGVDPSVTGKPSEPYKAPPADGVTFDRANKASFYPSGAVTPTGSVFLTDGRRTMAVTVAITGRPKIWRSVGGRKWKAM